MLSSSLPRYRDGTGEGLPECVWSGHTALYRYAPAVAAAILFLVLSSPEVEEWFAWMIPGTGCRLWTLSLLVFVGVFIVTAIVG
jgi:hypothetical protein